VLALGDDRPSPATVAWRSMEADPVVSAAGAQSGARPDGAVERRSALVLGSAFWGWAGPVLVMLFGGVLRFDRLSAPDAVVFDETYYVPDANSILRTGSS
jgi:hypothetical protein